MTIYILFTIIVYEERNIKGVYIDEKKARIAQSFLLEAKEQGLELFDYCEVEAFEVIA